MASNIGEIRIGVGTRIKDTGSKLSSVTGTGVVDASKDVDSAILAALEQYGKVRPRERSALVTGAGATVFDYALDGGSPILAGFVVDFSAIARVIYPWDATTPTPTELAREDYGILRLSSGVVLRFFLSRPLATEQFLVVYTTPHTVDATVSTVRASDDAALMDLAAAEACDRLAALYGHSTGGSIPADAVNNLSKSAEYRAMAKEYRAAYAAKMNAGGAAGSGDAMIPPAIAFGQVQDSFYEQPFRHFGHGRQR